MAYSPLVWGGLASPPTSMGKQVRPMYMSMGKPVPPMYMGKLVPLWPMSLGKLVPSSTLMAYSPVPFMGIQSSLILGS
jgi:hypothetical protein